MKSPILIAASLTALIAGCAPKGIHIVIVNNSAQTIETVEYWEGEDPTTETTTPLATAGPIAPAERAEVILKNRPGESSHSTEVTFEDGSQVTSGGTYTEGGYKLTEIVTETKVTVEYDTY